MQLTSKLLGVFIVIVVVSRGCECRRVYRQVVLPEGTSCQTPNAESGTCVNIRQCPRLLDMLRNQRNQPGTIQFLRSSMCGGTSSNPLVCCPVEQIPLTVGVTRAGDEFPNLLSPPTCGNPSDNEQKKIVGGSPAELGTWPWIAALGYRSNAKPGPRWLCGGSLISNRYVLTAAHCTKHPTLTLYLVRLGDLDLNRTDDGATPIDIGIERAIAHSSYSATKYTDDIALLKLKQTVTFTNLIRPICLPKAADLRAQSYEKFFPFVAGWGSTSFRGPSSAQLMQVQIRVISNDVCKQSYNTKGTDIITKQLCAGETAGGKDACQGDSGGPLMMPVTGNYYQIGVVSYGFRCAEAGFPGIYSRVTEYIDWISKNIV